ncbi:MAG: Rnf-Nqr domain containing protein [Eubacteriales bacterium]
MLDYLNIAISALFAQNLLLVYPFTLGNNPKSFLRPKGAFSLGFSLTAVFLLLTPLSRVFHQFLVTTETEHFLLLILALLATVGTYVVGLTMEKYSPDLWAIFGESFRSLPSNAGVLGVMLLSAQQNHSVLEAVVFGFFSGLGVLIALVTLVGVQQNQERRGCPPVFQGFPILFITAGLMSLSLVGFYGLQVN